MQIKFADGIDIVVDDEKLIYWQESADKTMIALKMNEEGHVVNYEVNLEENTLLRVKYGSYII